MVGLVAAALLRIIDRISGAMSLRSYREQVEETIYRIYGAKRIGQAGKVLRYLGDEDREQTLDDLQVDISRIANLDRVAPDVNEDVLVDAVEAASTACADIMNFEPAFFGPGADADTWEIGDDYPTWAGENGREPSLTTAAAQDLLEWIDAEVSKV